MKKFFKFLGVILIILIATITIYYFVNNESLPEGTSGKEADELAEKMVTALNKEAFDASEIIEWCFRNNNYYKWKKQEGLVEVTLDNEKVTLNLEDISKSEGRSEKLIQKALDNFNNDSFWLLAPYKVFDKGTERRIVDYEGNQALLVTYTSGGTTPGDSYLWIIDENGFPTSFKMWVGIIPLGGVSATWDSWKHTDAGFKLPTSHKLSVFGMELNISDVRAYNPNADILAKKILKAVKHDAYKNTRYINWDFSGRRSYKWDKQQHIVEIKWNDAKVILHPNNIDKSVAYLNDQEISNNENLVKRAWDYFNNDSFWLVAPHKLFEPGIIRSIKMIEGKEALQLKYTIGDTNPGDSYIWILDDNYMPVSYRMTVPSMNMNEVTATWEEWIETESGTILPQSHSFSNGRKLSMGQVEGYN